MAKQRESPFLYVIGIRTRSDLSKKATSVCVVLATATSAAPIDNAAVVAALNADVNDRAVYSLDGPFASMCVMTTLFTLAPRDCCYIELVWW